MSAYSIRRSSVAVVLSILAIAIFGGCSSSTSSIEKVDADDLASLTCKPNASSDLGSGDVCVDSGVRGPNLFTFANWGGRRYKSDDFGYEEMIAVYGKDAVCIDPAAEKCDVKPKAEVLRTTIDALLTNGRCEGMTALAALYMTGQGPNMSNFGVDSIQALSPRIDDFANVIDYWWSTQFLSDIVKQSNDTKKAGVRAVLQTVIRGIDSRAGNTVGLYGDEGAHSVLPVAVTRTSPTLFHIHVWDSNNPDRLGRIDIDVATETWTYKNARLNSSAPSQSWSGGNGAIDAVNLQSRKGQPVLEVDKSQRGTASVVASAPPQQNLALTIETNDGEKLIASARGATQVIPGAEVIPLKNGDVSQVIVSLPVSITAFTVSLTTVSAGANTGDSSTRLTVTSGENSAFTMAVPASDTGSSLSITADSSTQGGTSFSASATQPSSVVAATATSIVSFAATSNDKVGLVDSSQSGVDTQVTIESAVGETKRIAIAENTGARSVQEVVLTQTEDGALKKTVQTVSPVGIDVTKLQSLSNLTIKGSATQRNEGALSTIPVPVVSSQVSISQITETSALATVKLSSDSDAQVYVEFGPDLNWSRVSRTAGQNSAPTVGLDLQFKLEGLAPSTKYRFRAVVEAKGVSLPSNYSMFVTTGRATAEQQVAQLPATLSVTSALTSVTSNSIGVLSNVSSPVGSTLWVEYSVATDATKVFRTDSQFVNAGFSNPVTSSVTGLLTGNTYRLRVVVSGRGALVSSQVFEVFIKNLTGAPEPSVRRLNMSFSLAVSEVTMTSARVDTTIKGEASGVMQIEYFDGSSTLRTTNAPFTSSGVETVTTYLTNLADAVTYQVRVVAVIDGLTYTSDRQSFSTLGKTPTTSPAADSIGSPVITAAQITDTSAVFSAPVRVASSGTVVFEYGLDFGLASLSSTSQVPVDVTSTSTGPIASPSNLRSGTRYKVRAVLVVNGRPYFSQFAAFTTTGTVDASLYTATAPVLVRTSGSVAVSWSIPVQDTPSDLSFRVLDGATVLCDVAGTERTCTAPMLSTGSRSIVIATYSSGTEIGRSSASSIVIDSAPVIISFSSNGVTTNSVSVKFDFDPRGESVQYKLQLTDSNETLIRESVLGSTSVIVSGATQTLGQLLSSTIYKVRLVLVYGAGQSTVNSNYLTAKTN